MYQGFLNLHYFGNDTTTGTKWPYNYYTFMALPLGARCNSFQPGGKFCDLSTLQTGAPLTGSASALVGTGDPSSIMLPASQLERITTGSFTPRYVAVAFTNTHANLKNAAGSFKAGGGPGYLVYPPYSISPGTGVQITPGKNKFGGVMRLLAGIPGEGLGTSGKANPTFGVYFFDFPTWGATLVGATSNGGNPAVGYVTGTTAHATMPVTRVWTGKVQAWPWTTGKVRVFAYGDYAANSA
jgi:hypothetical protein